MDGLAAPLQQFLAGWWQTLLVVSGYIGALWLLEAWKPVEPGQSLRLRLGNLHYGAWAQGINLALTPWLAAALVGALREAWPGLLQVAASAPLGWRVLAALAYFVAADVLYYWAHRLQHEIPLLWRTHRLHHSDVAVNASTTLRTHWLEEPLKILVIVLPIHLLFEVPPQVTGLTGVLVGAWLFLVHANLRLGYGRIGHWLLVSPQVHRIHHSRLPQHRDCNYALFFPAIDRLFGTWHEPAPDEYPPTGLDTGRRIRGQFEAAFSPFMRDPLPAAGAATDAPAGGAAPPR